jgi:hypothetical protein
VSAESALARAHAAKGVPAPSAGALKIATRAHARLLRALRRRPSRSFFDACEDDPFSGADSDADSVGAHDNFHPSESDAAAADADAPKEEDDGGVDGCGGFGTTLRRCATPLALASFGWRLGGWRFTPSFEGELLACVNARRGRLELRLLRTRAALTPHQAAVLDKAPTPASAALAAEVLLPAFEVSRQLRVDVALASVSAVHVGNPGVGGPTKLRVLTLDLTAPPRFATRRLRAAASGARAWRRRGDFTPAGAASASSRIQLVASEADISALAALLQVTEPRLAPLLRASAGKVLPAMPPAFAPAPKASASAPAPGCLPADVAARRAGIVALLLAERLISAEAAAAAPSASTHKKASLNNHLARVCDADAFPPPPGARACLITPCFADYLNFSCTGADALRKLLARRVCIPAPSCNEEEEEEEREPTRVSVAEALRAPALLHNRDLFYSFCLGGLWEDEHHFHCATCAKCSLGREGNKCAACGVRRPRWAPPTKKRAVAVAAPESGAAKSKNEKRAPHEPLSVRVAAMCGFGRGDEDDDDDCYYGSEEEDDSEGERKASAAAPAAAQTPAGAALPTGGSDSEEDVVEWPGGGGVAGAPPRDERTQAQRDAEARDGKQECPVQ